MKKLFPGLLLAYLVFSFYLAVFNWGVFSVPLNISLGFSTVSVPLVALMAVVGLLFLTAQWGLFRMNVLQQERALAKKDGELMALKLACYEDPQKGINVLAEKLAALQEQVAALAAGKPSATAAPPKKEVSVAGS